MSFVYQSTGGDLLAVLGGLIAGIPSLTLGVAAYVLSALALYTVAKRREIRKPWLAWIPVVNVWLLGSLSDQYRYVVKGQFKSRRKVLLVLQIIICLLSAALIVAGGAVVFRIFESMAYMNSPQVMGRLFSSIGTVLLLALPVLGVTIAYKIVYYMALYDVYTSMSPENGVIFLVLSILFGITEPFFLFFNRNSDKGMPPRRAKPTQEPWEQNNNE